MKSEASFGTKNDQHTILIANRSQDPKHANLKIANFCVLVNQILIHSDLSNFEFQKKIVFISSQETKPRLAPKFSNK